MPTVIKDNACVDLAMLEMVIDTVTIRVGDNVLTRTATRMLTASTTDVNASLDLRVTDIRSVPQVHNCRGIPLNELAQCINGRCVCAQGFIESRPGTCTECVPSDCHVNAACLPNAQYGGVYSCQCKSGYSGDGVKNCDPDRGVGPELDPTCGGGCYVRNSECNRLTGRCECRHGYDGDGRISCTWNCQLCLPKAICDRENERCTCMEGYYGDGQTFCERITPQPEPVTVQITGQGDVIRVADLQKPLTLFCYVTTKDESITGQWTQPKGAQPAEVSMNRLPTGLEIQLRIAKPALTDAGRYYCRAKQAEAYIDVAIHETATENNKYARVAMVTDCNRQSVIYTCDFGNTIRWGNAHHTQKELSTSKIYQSQLARFRNLAVDPPSGNIYAWDEAASQMIVLNPDKPHMKHTLSNIGSFKQGEPVRLAGMALHSSRGLLYWAAFTDGWMPNGTIQVASMAGENERQLLQLNGEPLALSLSPSYDDMDKSAGRLCWIQRSITNVFALATEMHCARLSEDGRSVIMQERLRQFNPTEEPSWGLVHHRGTVLWTDASNNNSIQSSIFTSTDPSITLLTPLDACMSVWCVVQIASNPLPLWPYAILNSTGLREVQISRNR
ncbi:immunoglobulin domain protein [Opisthorchis viverrini]|uniref:Immunoglobulin domain protein n=1 Tax=Opisthorchis viverrini TaxID=6198 RepID=A0A1S8WGT7_OPIVI|nr:immunoglobulin domain protein [Opisthorchis viverrini]